MKKLLLFFTCVIWAFSACKKDGNKVVATNTIAATMNGTNQSFNNTQTAQLSSDTGTYTLLVTGINGTGSNAQSIQIAITSQSPITKGTYVINSTSDNLTQLPIISYTENGTVQRLLAFATFQHIPGNYTTSITISSVSSTNVQGTFNGILGCITLGTSTETITNGTFNVNITK